MKIIVATANEDKLKEIREILPQPPYQIMSQDEAGFFESVEETGTSFAENALIKARSVHRQTGGTVLADDSGLSIDLLGGDPGIYSARFAGEKTAYDVKIAALQDRLRYWRPQDWHAAFVCVMALVLPGGKEKTFSGFCRGLIATTPHGKNGFGYDPVFYRPQEGKTTAQMTPQEKHAISHRGQALRQVADFLQSL